VNVAVARPSRGVVAVAYLAYFAIAGAGEVLARQSPGSPLGAAVQVGSTIFYAILALLLCRLFGDPTRGAGALAMVGALIGCILQSLYYALGLGHGAYLLALVFFGVFLFCLGYLVIRSALGPRLIGLALMVGGIAACSAVLPVPPALAPLALLGPLAEGSLFLWLVVVAARRPRSLAR
jgi:hypothetical protein